MSSGKRLAAAILAAYEQGRQAGPGAEGFARNLEAVNEVVQRLEAEVERLEHSSKCWRETSNRFEAESDQFEAEIRQQQSELDKLRQQVQASDLRGVELTNRARRLEAENQHLREEADTTRMVPGWLYATEKLQRENLRDENERLQAELERLNGRLASANGLCEDAALVELGRLVEAMPAGAILTHHRAGTPWSVSIRHGNDAKYANTPAEALKAAGVTVETATEDSA